MMAAAGRTQRGGLCSLCVIVSVVLCLARTSDGQTTTTKVVLSKSLPSRNISYSQPQLNTSYTSSAEFRPRGMEHLYFITNLFLDLIQRDDSAALDNDELRTAREAGNMTETLVRLGLYEWRRLVQHHLGFAILAACGLLTALMTPFVGLIVCCCRCAGRCGGAGDEYDKRHDGCRRASLGVLLATFVIAVMFGLVASFVVNEYMERGVERVPSRLHAAIDDSQLFINNTDRQLQHLLVDNYGELQRSLDVWLDGCGERVEARLADVSRAVSVHQLADIAAGLRDVRTDLDTVVRLSGRLQERAQQLEVGLQDVQSELSVLLSFCESPGCRQLLQQYNISHLAVKNEFSRLPDVRRTAGQISALIENGVEAEVVAGQAKFDELSDRIQSEVASVVPQVRASIQEAGERLQEVARDVSQRLRSVKLHPAHGSIDTADQFLQEYSKFRYYMFFIVSGLVLVMVFCLVMGLFCGMCGRRPGDVFGDDTCNKGSGANFLLSGVFFYFLFGWLLLLAITCLFLVGGLFQFYVCDGLANPASPASGLAILQAAYPVEELFPDLQELDLTQVISRCHHNESIYRVLQLGPVYQLPQMEQLQERLNLEDHLQSLRQQIRVNTNVQILTPRGKEQLYEFARSDIATINYTAFTVALQESITSFDLSVMAAALEAAAGELPADLRDSANRLRNQAIILHAQQRVVDEMAELVETLGNATVSLQERAKFNHTSVTEAVVELIGLAERAQEYLQTRGSQELEELATEYTDDLLVMLSGYVQRVNGSIDQSVGRCGPLSNVYNATAVTVCNNVVYPLNGFWAAVGWCLVLLVPCVMLSLRLTPLYRKSEPFSGALLEEDLQLQRGSAAAAVAGGRQRRSESDASRYHHGYRAESPPYVAIPPRGHELHLQPVGAAHLRGDTDPKAPPLWDLNGGPPGYSDAAEFDRPPPYFFPGPAQQ